MDPLRSALHVARVLRPRQQRAIVDNGYTGQPGHTLTGLAICAEFGNVHRGAMVNLACISTPDVEMQPKRGDRTFASRTLGR